jgi:pimeloyl-ACP methyl ester carboxylesterase
MRRTAITPVLRCALVLLVGVAAGCGNASNGSDTTLAGVRFTTVGRTTATFVDTSRPTQPNGSFPGAPTRTLSSIVWYPGVAAAGAAAQEIPCQDGIAAKHHGDGDRCVVVEDAALDAAEAPYPLIVFSHGFGNGADATTSYAQALAGYGYVVVAPDFPLSNRDAPGGPTVNDVPAQAGDVSFLIDVFEGRVANAPAPFPGAIDAQRIGAAGRSLGGTTTLFVTHNVKYVDPRIRASAPVSPGWFLQISYYGSDGYFTGITTPLLIIGGSEDTTAPFPTNDQPPYDLANPPKILVDLLGQGHTPETPGANAALIAFFDAYLSGHTAELGVIDALEGAVVQKQL